LRAVVLGDDVFPRLDELVAKATHCATWIQASRCPRSVARTQRECLHRRFPAGEALATARTWSSPDAVPIPRSRWPDDRAFRLGEQEWDKLAAGTIAATSSSAAPVYRRQLASRLAQHSRHGQHRLPIVEAEQDGSFTITKHPGTGGRVHSDVVKEQLLYELGDPRNYITPDCVADFTSIRLTDTDRTACAYRHSRWPQTAALKVSISYINVEGSGDAVYSGRKRWRKRRPPTPSCARDCGSGLQFDEIYTEFLGVNACHGPGSCAAADPPEVQLRIGMPKNQRAVERFTRADPLVLNGPPGATGFGEGKPRCARSSLTGRRCSRAKNPDRVKTSGDGLAARAPREKVKTMQVVQIGRAQ